MSIGSWEPSTKTTTIDEQRLQQFIEFSRSEQLDKLAELIPEGDQQSLSGLMTLDQASWKDAAGKLSSDQIIHLIHFFTVAESALPGWEAGDKSPVIYLAKSLKARHEPLSKDLLVWIREHSNNRFLPYGPIAL